MDQQIKNQECLICGAKPQAGIILLNIMSEWYCGNCYLKIKEKVNKTIKELNEEIK